MKNAKKLLAILLAVLTFVSVAVIGVHAEDATSTDGASTAETTTVAPTLSPIQKANNELDIKGATNKIVGSKIEIIAPYTSSEIIISSTVELLNADGTPIEPTVGEVGKPKYIFNFKDVHKAELNEKGEIGAGKSEVAVKIAVDGLDGTFDAVIKFEGNKDENGHRYNEKVGDKVEPTYDEEGYQIYKCSCGATGRKDKTAKLPGKVTKVNCGSDLSVAKEGTIKIEPKIDMLGEPKYTVAYKSSDEAVATVNEKGEVAGIKIGRATITCTVTYTEDGKTVTVEDKVDVKVTYTLIQWVLVIAEAVITGTVFVWDLILDALGLMK